MQKSSLPAVDARYWAAIVAASMCGANTGDFAAHYLHLGHAYGLLPMAAIFLGILWAERRSAGGLELYYWLAIIVLRTAATNLADLGTHDLKLGFPAVIAGLAALMALILLIDRSRDSSPPTSAPTRVTLPATGQHADRVVQRFLKPREPRRVNIGEREATVGDALQKLPRRVLAPAHPRLAWGCPAGRPRRRACVPCRPGRHETGGTP